MNMPELRPLENTRLQHALPNSPALRTLLALLAGLVIEEEELGELHTERVADLAEVLLLRVRRADHARRVQHLSRELSSCKLNSTDHFADSPDPLCATWWICIPGNREVVRVLSWGRPRALR